MIKRAFYVLAAAVALSFVSCNDENGEETPQSPEVITPGEGEGTPGENDTTQTDKKVLFEASDLDENGWIWFDTAEKIEKYIGVINENDYAVDPEGKPIQLVYADIMPDYPASEASEEFVGAGTDGETGSEGSRTGAIMLQPSSGVMSINGGGFVVCMPSCYSYDICYSSNSRVMTRLVATTNVNAPMNNCLAGCTLDSEAGWRIISAIYAGIFKRLPAGINNWEGLEELNNNTDPIATIQSEDSIYVWFQSATPDTIYIHGIKVVTQEEAADGIVDANAADGNRAVYSVDGRRLAGNLAEEGEGLYIVTEQGKSKKVLR